MVLGRLTEGGRSPTGVSRPKSRTQEVSHESGGEVYRRAEVRDRAGNTFREVIARRDLPQVWDQRGLCLPAERPRPARLAGEGGTATGPARRRHRASATTGR